MLIQVDHVLHRTKGRMDVARTASSLCFRPQHPYYFQEDISQADRSLSLGSHSQHVSLRQKIPAKLYQSPS